MTKYFTLLFLVVFISSVTAQEILFQEDFNDCALPNGWNLNVTNGQDAGVTFTYPLNTSSDSLSIDGTCMVIFDDDILGDNMPDFRAELQSPTIQAADFQTIYLRTDVHFRVYENSSFTVYLEEEDGTRIELRRFDEDDQTGTRFSEISPMSVDVRFVTESESFSLVYVYDDAGHYAWWAGIDNIEVIGSGTGTTVIKEQFNDCALPTGWTTNILEGDDEFQFGEVGNEKANATTMDGSCFAFFDDDGIGQEAAFSTVELLTPIFDGSAFANFHVDFDLIFRPYTDIENITVLVFDGSDYTVVEEFSDPIGGEEFNVYESISLNLSTYRSSTMQVVFRYDDGNNWGWWVGIDNVKIIAEGQINDICTNADPLEIGKACIHSNNKSAVMDGALGGCGDQLIGGLWYELMAPANGIIKIENKSNYNDVITVFSGSCTSLTSQLCGNADEHGFSGETVFLDAIANETYYIRVSGTESTYGLSRGDNCLAAEYIPAKPEASIEDNIANAISLVLGEECTQAINTNASVEGMVPAENDLMRSDIWYLINTSDHTALDVKVESAFAENITVFDNTNNEIYSQMSGGSFTVNDLLANTDYYLQVGGVFSKIEGEVCVQVVPKEEGESISDDCLDAMFVSMEDVLELDNSAQTFSGVQPSCEIYVGSDHWLQFSTLDNVNIYITTDIEYVYAISVYQGTCEDLSEVWCTQQRDHCDGAILIEGLQPQSMYYLQLSAAYTDNDEGKGVASIMLSENMPIEENLSLNVSVTCDDNEMAQLDINIVADSEYTLYGNTAQDILYHGDSYTIVAEYADGCEKSVQGVVNCQSDDCNLEVIPFAEYLSCMDAEDGSIALDISGGVGPYNYEWSHTTDDAPVQTALSSGMYTVKITDARACYIYQDIEILAPNQLTTIVSATDETTAGSNDGTASITASGGTLPYRFLWSSGGTASSVSNLSPGEHSVTVTDFNGCESVKTFSVSEVNCVFSILVAETEITCFGSEDASLSVASNDISIEAVLWSTGAESFTVTDLAAGDYSVTVYADNGCNKIQQYTILEPEKIIVEATIEPVSCEGGINGAIALEAIGGTGVIQFSWEDGSMESTMSNLTAGNYKVTATDENGCSEELSIDVTSPQVLSIASSMASDLTCYESQDGILCAFVEGGTEPYEFAWDGLTESLAKVTDLAAGNYSLTVTDVNGCSTETALSIAAPEQISVQLETMSIDDMGSGLIDITIEGGTAPYDVVWYLGEAVIAETEDIDNLAEGIYHAVITDANGCGFTSVDYILSLTAVTEIASSNIDVFPNPTLSKCTITADINDWSEYSLKLVSLQGEILDDRIQVTSTSNGIANCEITNVVSGIYYLQLDSKKDVSISYRDAIMIVGEVE